MTNAERDVPGMIRALRSQFYIWCVEQLARFDSVAASMPFRVARTAMLILAMIYAGLTLYQSSKQYGFNADAMMASASSLNSDTYDMGSVIGSKLGLSAIRLAARPMQFTLLCAPEKLTPVQAERIEQLHRSVAAQLRRHSGESFVQFKALVEAGDPHVVIQLTPFPFNAIKMMHAGSPEDLWCGPSFREIERFPASIYYDPKPEDLHS